MKKVLHARIGLALTLLIMGTALAGCGGSANVASTPADFGSAPAAQAADVQPASLQQGPPLTGTVHVTPSPMLPGQPARWMLWFHDASTNRIVMSPGPITLFSISHDLSTMAHLHPGGADGATIQDINRVTGSKGNEDAPHAAPKAGPLLVFAEVPLQDQSVSLARIDLTVQGQEQPVPLRLDPSAADGTVTKFFTADGQPGRQGAPFQVKLRPRQGEGDVLLDFTIQAFDAGTGTYTDVKDLEEWAGHLGHAVVVSERGSTAQDKVFHHLISFPMGINKGPQVTFVLIPDFERGQVFKVWGQFKWQNRLVAFPFVVRI